LIQKVGYQSVLELNPGNFREQTSNTASNYCLHKKTEDKKVCVDFKNRKQATEKYNNGIIYILYTACR